MKNILDFIRCTFFTHEPPEQDEDEVFTVQYGHMIYSKCIRCQAPIKMWRDPSSTDEDHYWIQEVP